VRVSVVVGQLPSSWNIRRNLLRIIAFLQEECPPGSLVALPEGSLTGYDDALSGLAGLKPSDVLGAAGELADAVTRANVDLLVGSLWPDETGRWANAALLLTPNGSRSVYRKVNLATHERGRLCSGSELSIYELNTSAGVVRAGIQLCRELIYPEQWHVIARSGAQMIAYLTHATNPAIPQGIWRSHLVSRAAETQRFVLAANVAHPDQHCPSMILSPTGEVIAETAGSATESLRATLDLSQVSDWRIRQQRSDIVTILYQTDVST
jgi:predicted amidohydrolase